MTRFVRDPHLDLLDDARQEAAVADRSHRRHHGEATAADASLHGVLLDLAEQGRDLLLATTVGRAVRGRVRSLAQDHVEVATATGAAWVRLDAVAVVRPSSGPVTTGGGARPAPATGHLVAALRELVERRATVEAVVLGGATVRGTAVSIGRDVLTLAEPATSQEQLLHLATTALVQTSEPAGTP